MVCGLLLRALFVICWPHVEGDSLVYADLARNVLHHHIYGITEAARIRPTLIRLPGYPLFLAGVFAVTGGKWAVVLWLQVGFDLAACWLMAATAEMLAGERAGGFTMWAAALCPFTANYTSDGITETLVVFTVAAAFYALLRVLRSWQAVHSAEWWLLWTGAALAASVVLRPDQCLLSVAVILPLAWTALRGGYKAAQLLETAAICAVLLMPLSMWATRNWRVFHVFQPLAPRFATDPGEPVSYGFQRWYRTWGTEFASTDAVYWAYDGSPLTMDVLPSRACDTPAQCAATQNLLAFYNQTSAASPAADAGFAQLAAERIQAHPLRYYVEMPVLRLADMWLRPRVENLPLPVRWWRWREAPAAAIFCAVYGLLDAAYLLAACLGAWWWWRRRWSPAPALAAAMVLFVALRCALLLTIDNSEPRYTLECFPVVIVLAGMALAAVRGGTQMPWEPAKHLRSQ
jgi:hypothetical protein